MSAILFVSCVVVVPVGAFGQAYTIGKEDSSARKWDGAGTQSSRATSSGSSSRGGPSGSISGINGRVGHIGFETFGRDTGLTHVELFPFIQDGNQILFSDLRGFIDNDGEFGGNFGAGYRFAGPGDMFMVGGSVWYDIDQTTGELFHQGGINLEAGNEFITLSGNYYHPFGDDEEQFSSRAVNPHFEGNEILFDVQNKFGEAMKGFDANLSVRVPGDFAEDRNLEILAGYYHFDGDIAEAVNGARVKVSGFLTETLSMHSTVTHDDMLGTKATIGIEWNFGSSSSNRPTGMDAQLQRYVDRNYNIIVDSRTETVRDVAAINPDTGLPYNVQHVIGGGGSTGDGTPLAPYGSVAEAQAVSGTDIIYLHAGSVIEESVFLQEGQYLLGGGSEHWLVDDQYGRFRFPDEMSSTTTPIIRNSSGDAIVLENNTFVSGINIESPTGNGISSSTSWAYPVFPGPYPTIRLSGLSFAPTTPINATVENVTITDAGKDGIFLLNHRGNINFHNITINGAAETGVAIAGLYHHENENSTITFWDDLNINDSGTVAISVQHLASGTGTDDDGNDIDLIPRVQFERVNIDSDTGADGVLANAIDGIVYFHELNAKTEDGTALLVRDSDNVEVRQGTLESTDAAVIDIEDSTVNINLNAAHADGGDVGVRAKNMEGSLLVFGNGSLGSGGTIQNVDTAVWLENVDTVGFQLTDFTDNDVFLKALDSQFVDLAVVRVTGTSEQVIDAHNLNILEIDSSLFESNDASSGKYITFTSDNDDSKVASFVSNTFSDAGGNVIDLEADTAGMTPSLKFVFELNEVVLDGTDAVANNINWNGPIDANITSNRYVGVSSRQQALAVHSTGATQLANINFSSNTIDFSGNNSVGVDIMSAGPAIFEATANQFLLSGDNNTVFQFEAEKASDFGLFQNQIQSTGGGTDGVVLTAVEDGSSLFMSENVFSFSTSGGFVDRGVIIEEVTGTAGTIQLNSALNNTITGANTIFFAPLNSTEDALLINDVFVD